MKRLLSLMFLIVSCAVPAYAQQTTADEYKKIEVFVGYTAQHVETEQFNDLSHFAGLPTAQIISNFNVTQAQAEEGFRDAFKTGRNLHGLNVSGTVYLHKHIGLTADFALARSHGSRSIANNQLFFEDVSRAKRRSYSFLFGPQVKLRRPRFEPFAHALLGVVRQTNNTTLSINSAGAAPGTDIQTLRLRDNYTAFNLALGGGIDIPLSRRLAIRAIQLDYNPVFTRDRDARLIAPAADGTDGNSLGRTSFAASRRDNLRFSIGVIFR